MLDEEESIFRPQVWCDDGIFIFDFFFFFNSGLFRVSKTLIHHRAQRLAPTYSAKRLLHQKMHSILLACVPLIIVFGTNRVEKRTFRTRIATEQTANNQIHRVFFFCFHSVLFKEYIDIRELLCSQKDGREIIVGEGV